MTLAQQLFILVSIVIVLLLIVGALFMYFNKDKF